MVDRITTSSRYDMLIADMQMNQFNYNKLTAQLSSGSKILSLTDDPIASVNILNTTRQLGQIETFEENVGLASSEVSALDDLLSLASGYLSNAWDKAVQANNHTYTAGSLEALKVEIDEITKTMVDLANSEYNDNYIFSGANTKTVTFTIKENGDVVYNGTPHDNPDYIRQTEVADGVFEVINTTGDRIFGEYKAEVGDDQDVIFSDKNNQRVIKSTVVNPDDGTTTDEYRYEDGTLYEDPVADLTPGAVEVADGVIGALRQLSNAIQKVLDGNSTEGYDEMQATLDKFAESHNTIVTEQTKFGGIANRLEMTTSTLETNSTNLTSYLSQSRDIDYTTAITQWLQAQYAYQASMQVASSSMGMSLLNYIQ